MAEIKLGIGSANVVENTDRKIDRSSTGDRG
jgi:hypothetical protein